MPVIIPAALAAVLLVAPLRAHEVAGPPDIRAWLDEYEAALNARDLPLLQPSPLAPRQGAAPHGYRGAAPPPLVRARGSS